MKYKNKSFFNASGLKYQATLKWISLIFGPVGLVAALFLDYKQRHAESLQITKVPPPVVKHVVGKSDIPPKKLVEDAESASSAKTQKLDEKQRY